MRRVELVVKYLEGPELPAPQVEWAGVFINDEDIDSAFADAEPPTHDDWQAHMVEDNRSAGWSMSRSRTSMGNCGADSRQRPPLRPGMDRVRAWSSAMPWEP